MYFIEIYKQDEKFESMEDMMIAENLVKTLTFNAPQYDEDFENIMKTLDYKDYLYKLYLIVDEKLVLLNSGLFSVEVLYNNFNRMDNYLRESSISMPTIDPEGPLKGKRL